MHSYFSRPPIPHSVSLHYPAEKNNVVKNLNDRPIVHRTLSLDASAELNLFHPRDLFNAGIDNVKTSLYESRKCFEILDGAICRQKLRYKYYNELLITRWYLIVIRLCGLESPGPKPSIEEIDELAQRAAIFLNDFEEDLDLDELFLFVGDCQWITAIVHLQNGDLGKAKSLFRRSRSSYRTSGMFIAQHNCDFVSRCLDAVDCLADSNFSDAANYLMKARTYCSSLKETGPGKDILIELLLSETREAMTA